MTPTVELRDERDMIADILKGESHVFHDLIPPYERHAHPMDLSYLHNEADAEDVEQELFLLKAFCNLSNFRGESKFSTWLLSIVLNEARNRLRRAKMARTQSLTEMSDSGAKFLHRCSAIGERYPPEGTA